MRHMVDRNSLVAACVVVLSACTLCAASKVDKAKIAAVKAEIASNSVNCTVKSRYYTAWFVDLCTKEELDAILQRNIAAHKRWKELDPENCEPFLGLGRTYATIGRWDEAKKEFEQALSSKYRYVKAHAAWELANCLWREGDKEGVKKLLEVPIKESNTWDSLKGLAKKSRYIIGLLDDPDADLDMLKLPHSVDGKPFPTPHEAKYGEKKVSLARVEIKVRTNGTDGTDGTSPASRISPVSPEGPIIRLLKKKLTRFGAKFEKGGTPIEIELSPDAPVDKPQGYSLDVANGNVVVKARSRLGALWGVVSLIQCVDRGELAICECEIRDWPKCLRRGARPYWEPELLEYALFNKMSMINVNMGHEWSISPLDRERHRLTALHFTEFGIETQFAIRSVIMEPMLPLSSPRTRKLHLSLSRFFASLGVGAKFDFDDSRFPMHPLDLENAGTAANLDPKYLTGIYREVKKDYPGFTMGFCPPFYWGPDSPATYPEPRDTYLKSLASDLDPEIEVDWTGPRVKTGGITPKRAEWITSRIGRKPVVVSNGNSVGKHSYVSYGADLSGFKKSHCPEVFDLVAAFLMNMSSFRGADGIGSCADWCWNPDAHDPSIAVRRTIEQVEGPGVSEALAAAIPDLTYLDKYPYGRPSIEALLEDQAHLDRIVALAEKTWSNVTAIAKNNGRFVYNFYHFGVQGAKRIAETRRNPPEKFLKERDAVMANTAFAKKEVGFDESTGDLFFPSAMMRGGFFNPRVRDWSGLGDRGIKYLAPDATLSISFPCDDYPPERPPKLIIVGMLFQTGNLPTVEIVLNGRSVWRNEAFNVPHYFKPIEIELPIDALLRSNNLDIRNVSEKSPGIIRQAEIHYAVIKR